MDLQRKRIALTMRLDEQPVKPMRAAAVTAVAVSSSALPPGGAKPRGRDAQPAGNSAMMDALAAAMGKKRWLNALT